VAIPPCDHVIIIHYQSHQTSFSYIKKNGEYFFQINSRLLAKNRLDLHESDPLILAEINESKTHFVSD
jgi:hypothetical protein